jgi:hypothetical protein
MCRTEPENEIEESKKLERRVLLGGRERPHKVDRWCGWGGRLTEELREALDLVPRLR